MIKKRYPALIGISLAAISLVVITGTSTEWLFIPTSAQNTTTGQNATTGQNTTTGQSTPTGQKGPGPFQGDSIVISVVGGFYDTDRWQTIDDLASSGYDIKDTVVRNNMLFVILERTSEP